ncbi:MAG: hypothetical protein AMJ90_01450 [candidate division Zixibacteria bacterium SM23_73_2]|nr:MAG: hypothetical protein AMJ90_01450 [candidate division Zixibacteria bacterium SM23_73_2]
MNKAEVEKRLKDFVKIMRRNYGPNLTFIIHHGSWATGEAKPDSDLDILSGLKKVGNTELLKLKKILREKEFLNFNVLLFSKIDMENYIPYGWHQFYYGAKLLYGKRPLPKPTKKQELLEIQKHADEIGFWGRYLFTHRHPRKRVVRSIYWRLKEVIICLKVWVNLKENKYPLTKKELKKYLSPKDKKLVEISENWGVHKPKFLKNPDPVLLELALFSQRILRRVKMQDARVKNKIKIFKKR